jgi:hypothetical protein
MATRSELAHAAAERKGPSPKRSRKLAQRKSPTEAHKHHEPKRAGRKASYAQEEVGETP